MSAADTMQIVHTEQTPDSDKKSSPRTGKKRTRYAHFVVHKGAFRELTRASKTSAKSNTVSQQQWGPLLVMAGPETGKRYYGFDPTVKAQQEHLLTLGFDVGEADGFKGPRTRQAIAEFRALYLPDSGQQLQDADPDVAGVEPMDSEDAEYRRGDRAWCRDRVCYRGRQRRP